MKAVVFTLCVVVLTLSVLVGIQFSDNSAARVTSCERTYEGVRQVFEPFFRPPDKRTPKERHDIAKFNHRIDALKRSCR